MNLPFDRPLDKVTNGALAAALVVVVAWALREFVGVDLPAEVQSALALIVGFGISYLVPLSAAEAEAIAQAYYRNR